MQAMRLRALVGCRGKVWSQTFAHNHRGKYPRRQDSPAVSCRPKAICSPIGCASLVCTDIKSSLNKRYLYRVKSRKAAKDLCAIWKKVSSASTGVVVRLGRAALNDGLLMFHKDALCKL